eukprot:56343-Eustigmatos_ZCMA.PRE.1
MWGTLLPWYDSYKQCEANYNTLMETHQDVVGERAERETALKQLRSEFKAMAERVVECDSTRRVSRVTCPPSFS